MWCLRSWWLASQRLSDGSTYEFTRTEGRGRRCVLANRKRVCGLWSFCDFAPTDRAAGCLDADGTLTPLAGKRT